METRNIILFEEGDSAAALRTQNSSGEKARSMLIDQGSSLVLQASLVNVTNGDFTHDGDVASLLIFEFSFIGRRAHRFTGGTVKLVFEDASGDVRNKPVVSRIAPFGSFAINKETTTRNVSQSFKVDVNAPSFGGAGGGIGYNWETSAVEKDEHAAKLTGLKRVTGDGGKADTAIWDLQEDRRKKNGIPSFLRTAVLLKRRDDVPFRFTIMVESEVDFGGKVKRLFGREKPDLVDPVELDEEVDLDALGITKLDPKTPGLDLTNMRDMDLEKHSQIVIATLLDIPG